MEEVELRIVSELMKNSRRSDRELAKTLSLPQSKVARVRTKLEKQGCVREYSIIPDLSKLGFKILAMTFVKRRKDLTAEEMDRMTELAGKAVEKNLKNVMTMRGMGLGYDAVIVSVHESYSSYMELVNGVKTFPLAGLSEVQSFLIDLEDKVQYRPLTFSFLADYLLSSTKSGGKAGS